MLIDIVSIFPDYFAPLDLSLPGKARQAGLIDVRVHDLRNWTHDRHRTVDDSPYGGGAGMVMQPQPWGEALDELLVPSTPSVLVVPTPAGVPFSQAGAADLAARPHLVFACGRYEGIDQRVLDDSAARVEVREVSLGDYVLNGGEVAALAVIEAVVRLLPGVLGNPDSLAEESHTAGLLEYPVFTKPATWRGREVPEVLLSGDHARIAAWRHAQSVRRTAERRPDLAHASRMTGLDHDDLSHRIRPAVPADAGELLTLQRACWAGEPEQPSRQLMLDEQLAEVEAWIGSGTTLVLRAGSRLVAVVRGHRSDDRWEVSRLMVAPDLRGRGLPRVLLTAIEAAAPPDVRRFVLSAGSSSDGPTDRAGRIARTAGYRPSRTPIHGHRPASADEVVFTKPRAEASDA